MVSVKKVLSFSLLLLVALLVWLGKPIPEKPWEGCKKIVGTPGPEDLDFVPGRSEILVSSHDRRGGRKALGAMYSFFWQEEAQKGVLQKWEISYPENFRPHGISYAKIQGKDTVAVISHTLQEENPHTIEVFEVEGGTWKHKRTLQDPSLTSPNDLFLTESGEIFVSNDNGTSKTLPKLWEMVTGKANADISYFDGNSFRPLGVPVVLGNGIFVYRREKKEILLRSVFSEKAIREYEILRTSTGLELKYLGSIPIGSGPDNLMPEEKGTIWLAAHPSVYKFILHSISAWNEAPTQVFRLQPEAKQVELVYANRGNQIPAGSTALPVGKNVFISQVFEDYFLICPKP